MILVDYSLENVQLLFFLTVVYNFMFNNTFLVVANIKQSTPSHCCHLTK